MNIARTALKWILIFAAITYLMRHLHFRESEMLLVVTIIILILALMLMKKWFPFAFNVMKSLALWSVRSLASVLWQKKERKGGASVRSQRLRWRP